MRLGFFLQNNKKGGLDTFLINLINDWPNKDDELILFCNKSHPGLNNIDERTNNFLKIIEYDFLLIEEIFSIKFLPKSILNLVKLCFLLISFPYNYFKLKPIIFSQKLDKFMVINGGYPGGEVCRAASVVWGRKNKNNKAWHNFHNLVDREKIKLYHPVSFYNYLIDILVKKYSRGFVSVSNACSQTLKNRRIFKSINAQYIYNGADVYISSKSQNLHKKYNLNSSAKILLMLAVYEKRKGHEFMFNVMQHLFEANQKIYLLVFGDGNSSEIDYVKNIKNSFECSKNILINKYTQDISPIIKGSDLLVIPSQEYESFGYTAIEAMAHKLPVISTNIGGLPEVVNHKNTGFVVDRNNSKLFAEKIIFILNDKSAKVKMGLEGYKRYNTLFRAKTMAKNYRELILD